MTSRDLTYRDAKSGDEWVWPLKHLRKYGCDGDIFSFEAGRKCPGGEGLYAFSTRKASQLFDMVAKNISEGGLEEMGVTSPHNDPGAAMQSPLMSPVPPPVPVSNPPPVPPISQIHQTLPEYQNITCHHGQVIGAENPLTTSPPGAEGPYPHPVSPPSQDPQGAQNSTPSPPPIPVPPRVHYTEVSVVQEASGGENSQESRDKEQEPKVSYSQIDIKQTEEYNRQLQKMRELSMHPLPEITGGFTLVDKSAARKGNGHSRLHPQPLSAHRTQSESSIGSLPSPTSDVAGETSTSALLQTSQANGGIPGRSHTMSHGVTEPILYQNVPQQLQQPNYMNLTPQTSSVSHGGHHASSSHTPSGSSLHSAVAAAGAGIVNRTPQPQLNQPLLYENLQMGRSTPIAGHSHSGYISTSPPRLANMDPFCNYADLQLSSTPKPGGAAGAASAQARNRDGERQHANNSRFSDTDDSHAVLRFPSASTNTTPAPSISINRSPDHSEVGSAVSSNVGVGNLPQRSSGIGDDETKVPYQALDFTVMAALRKTQEQRNEDRQRLEEERRREDEKKRKEKEEKEAKALKKKEKKERKDRRNSHN